MDEQEHDNPIMEHIVSGLGFVCLAALAVQTWFFIDWLMGSSDWWMKYLTLSFFDIFGGIWLILSLFHTPPSKGTYQMVRAGIVVCFILSASTTVAWCFIFITRTPLSPDAIANMVGVARWLVVVAVIFNAFLMIFYSVETNKYHQKRRNPTRKRWATERVYSTPQTVAVEAEKPVNKPAEIPEVSTNKPDSPAGGSTNKSIPPTEVSTNTPVKKKRKLPQ